jgi:hypothetical protein
MNGTMLISLMVRLPRPRDAIAGMSVPPGRQQALTRPPGGQRYAKR